MPHHSLLRKAHHVISYSSTESKPNYSINYRFFELECKLERNVKLPKCVTILGILMIINGALLIGGAVFTIYFVPILIGQITEIMEGNLTSNLGNLTVNFGNLSDSEQIRSPQLVATITNTIATIDYGCCRYRDCYWNYILSVGMGFV